MTQKTPTKPPLLCESGVWNLADAFRFAANTTEEQLEGGKCAALSYVTCVFLYFRSVELSLKSVLLHHGYSDSDLRKAGHSLSALMLKVESFEALSRFAIGPEEREFLDRYSPLYASKWYEYSTEWKTPEAREELRRIANGVVDAARNYRISGSHPLSGMVVEP